MVLVIRVGKEAQPTNALDTKTDSLSLIPRTYVDEGEN